MNASLGEWMPWVQALGWTLLHFIWQGIVVGVGFAAVRALLPKANCNARYAAGLAALTLLTVWPLATLFALRPQSTDEIVAQAAATSDVIGASVAEAAGSSALAPIDHMLPLLVLLWCAGVLVVAARAWSEWRALARIAREWATSSSELDAMLSNLSARFGFMRRIRVLVSERIDAPMLIGWIKPIVLLPTAVALGFPRQQVELILAHELGHLRRYDHLVNLAQALLETLLFYHPVVHWISREVRNERELCCDVLVLRLTRSEPREYARTLAALEELRQPPMQVALAASGGVLLERVRRIVGMPAPRLGSDQANPVRWLLIAATMTFAFSMALRVEREGETRFVGGLTVDWLTQPDVRALPVTALTLPFQRPHLRPVEIAPAVINPPAVARATPVVVAQPATIAVKDLPTPTRAPEVITSDIPSAALSAPDTAPGVTVEHRDWAKPATARAPVPTRIVAPTFPSTRNQAGQVDASFQIAADGSLRDIRIADNGAGAGFVRAAERALQQWRFDPATLSADRSLRFQQSFVFATPSRGAARAETPCVTSTGSLICRPPDSAVGPITTIIIGGH